MTETLPGFEPGQRSEEKQFRVIVNPDHPEVRWVSHVPSGADPAYIARQFVVPTVVEHRLIITYTGPWTRDTTTTGGGTTP